MNADIQNEIEQRIRARALWDEFEEMNKEAVGFGAVKKVLGMFKAAPKKRVLSPVEQMAKKFMADPRALKSVGPRPTGAAAQRIADAHGARPGRKFAAMREEFMDLAEKRVKLVQRPHDIVEVEPGSINLTKTSLPIAAVRKGFQTLMRSVSKAKAVPSKVPGTALARVPGPGPVPRSRGIPLPAPAGQRRVPGLGGRGQGPIAGGQGGLTPEAFKARRQAVGKAQTRQNIAKPFKAVGEGLKKHGPGVAKTVALGGSIAAGGVAIGGASLLKQHAQQQMTGGGGAAYR